MVRPLRPPAHPPAQPRHRRLLAAVSALALCLAPAAPLPALAQNQLPALGDAAAQDFNVGTERKLGEQIMREIRRDPDYLDDPLLLEYLNALWQPLLVQGRKSGHISDEIASQFRWEAFLVRDRSVNAFALPGGFIGVHLGLIALTATRDELASVLAHELAHVTQRHIARSISNNERLTMINAAALVLGVIAASRANSADALNAVIAGSQAAAIQGQLNFSRDMEREADRIGLSMLAGSGFAPQGMPSMFEKLDQSSRFNDTGGYPYLRSHPLNTERIGQARSRVESLAPPAAANEAQAAEHRIAQARARVLMDTRPDALRRWQFIDGERRGGIRDDSFEWAYSSALASTLLRDWARADASLAQARLREAGAGADRQQRAWRLLMAQSQLARGDAGRAATALEPLLAGDGSRPVMLLAAQTAVAAARGQSADGSRGAEARDAVQLQLKRSADAMQTWVALHPDDSSAWSLLSQLWGGLNQPLRALRADAESRLALGDLNGAVDRLLAARRVSREDASKDFVEASVVDARLRELQGQRRQQLEQERPPR